jgi:WD40 repeat protein
MIGRLPPYHHEGGGPVRRANSEPPGKASHPAGKNPRFATNHALTLTPSTPSTPSPPTTLAPRQVAYGRFDVSGWSEAPGALCTWNLGKKADAGATHRKPDVTIDCDSPLQALAFHPTAPALVAGGTLTGALMVWDLSREEDNLRGQSRITDYSHKAPITQVVWHFNAAEASKYAQKENAYQLVTLGTDGRVLIWNWRNLDAPVYAYELIHKRPDPKNPKQVLWGGTAMSFHPYTALTDTRVRHRPYSPCGSCSGQRCQ